MFEAHIVIVQAVGKHKLNINEVTISLSRNTEIPWNFLAFLQISIKVAKEEDHKGDLADAKAKDIGCEAVRSARLQSLQGAKAIIPEGDAKEMCTFRNDIHR